MSKTIENDSTVLINYLSNDQLPDGTAASPSIKFSNDDNTGIYRVGNDSLGITAGGTLQLSASSSEVYVEPNLNINGELLKDSNYVIPMVRYVLDLTAQDVNTFYPVILDPPDYRVNGGSSGPSASNTNFSIYGSFLGAADSYNDNTLIGHARGRSSSDKRDYCEVTILKYSATEIRIMGIYGTNTSSGGLQTAIYLRGAYNYAIITDASGVSLKTAAFTTGSATFALKDSTGADVSGTSAGISQLVLLSSYTSLTQQKFFNAGLVVLNTAASSSTTSGALIVSGGAGISGAVYSTNHFCGLGSATAASYSFSGDTNTGMYSSGADVINFTTGGTSRLSISTSGITSTLPYINPLGSASAPSYSFTGDTNTGIYSSGADTLDFTTGGTNRMSISTSGVTCSLPIYRSLGSVSAPSYSFTGDTNTGMYSSGADVLDFTTGGTNRLSISTSAVTSTLPINSTTQPLTRYENYTYSTSIADSTFTYVDFSLTTQTINQGSWVLDVNNDITIPSNGTYMIVAWNRWTAATGRYMIAINKNRTTIIAQTTSNTISASYSANLQVSTIDTFTSGDKIGLYCQQVTGGSVQLGIVSISIYKLI